jgi:hypothetical protein
MSDSTTIAIRPAATGDGEEIYRVHTGPLLSAATGRKTSPS